MGVVEQILAHQLKLHGVGQPPADAKIEARIGVDVLGVKFVDIVERSING